MKIVKTKINKKVNLIASISFALLASYQQINAQEINAGNMFGTNATNDGPITVCSDSLSYSQNDHQMIYLGNVLVIQASNSNIQCVSNSNIVDKNKKSTNYNFGYSKKKIDYDVKQSQELLLAKKICKQQKGCRFLSGQKLKITFTADNKKITDVSLITSKPYKSMFYSYPFSNLNDNSIKAQIKGNKQEKDKEKIYASGRLMTFDMFNNKLTINKDAYIDRNGNQFSGDKVIYDSKSGLVKVPNTGERATVILNSFNSGDKETRHGK